MRVGRQAHTTSSKWWPKKRGCECLHDFQTIALYWKDDHCYLWNSRGREKSSKIESLEHHHPQWVMSKKSGLQHLQIWTTSWHALPMVGKMQQIKSFILKTYKYHVLRNEKKNLQILQKVLETSSLIWFLFPSLWVRKASKDQKVSQDEMIAWERHDCLWTNSVCSGSSISRWRPKQRGHSNTLWGQWVKQESQNFIHNNTTAMSYTINNTGVRTENADPKPIWFAELTKKTLLFWKKYKMQHKVFFDVYDRDATQRINIGYATIDQDWIKLKARERVEIMTKLTILFAQKYMVTIGNFRNTLKKV